MRKFTIAAAYKWPKKNEGKESNNSELAIKKIVDSLKSRFSKNKTNNQGCIISLDFRRLRSSAGKTIIDSIIKRIETCNTLIVDITNNNLNVYLELGVAISRARRDENFSLYLIKELKDNENVNANLPSDLQGYFVSGYIIVKGIPVFKDNSSLLMSIVGDINDYYSVCDENGINTDEVNFKE